MRFAAKRLLLVDEAKTLHLNPFFLQCCIYLKNKQIQHSLFFGKRNRIDFLFLPDKPLNATHSVTLFYGKRFRAVSIPVRRVFNRLLIKISRAPVLFIHISLSLHIVMTICNTP